MMLVSMEIEFVEQYRKRVHSEYLDRSWSENFSEAVLEEDL